MQKYFLSALLSFTLIACDKTRPNAQSPDPFGGKKPTLFKPNLMNGVLVPIVVKERDARTWGKKTLKSPRSIVKGENTGNP